MKKKIRLTESQLTNFIREAVKKALREDYDDYDSHPAYREFDDMDDDFADRRGRSALRKSTRSNPRNQPCPTCGRENALTMRDVDLGYQCDSCADRAEGIGWFD